MQFPKPDPKPVPTLESELTHSQKFYVNTKTLLCRMQDHFIKEDKKLYAGVMTLLHFKLQPVKPPEDKETLKHFNPLQTEDSLIDHFILTSSEEFWQQIMEKDQNKVIDYIYQVIGKLDEGGILKTCGLRIPPKEDIEDAFVKNEAFIWKVAESLVKLSIKRIYQRGEIALKAGIEGGQEKKDMAIKLASRWNVKL